MSDQDPAEQQPLLPISYDGARSRSSHTCRENVASFLESRRLHVFVLTLIVVDACCVVADIAHGLLADGCAPESLPEEPFWLEVIGYISLAITTLFLVEIPFAIWAFGIKFYLPFSDVAHAPLHLFDAIIIITTFVLEFVLKGKERDLAELLVILRLWRLVKLVGGITVGAGEIEEQVYEELEQTKRQLEGSTAALAKAREENRKLRARVVWFETGGSEGSEL